MSSLEVKEKWVPRLRRWQPWNRVLLSLLALSKNPEVRAFAAGRPETGQSTLRKLTGDQDPRVLHQLARNQECTGRTLEMLPLSIPEVVYALTCHPHSSRLTLEKILANTQHPGVLESLAERPELGEGTLKEVLMHAQVSGDKNLFSRVLLKLARNPGLGRQALLELTEPKQLRWLRLLSPSSEIGDLEEFTVKELDMYTLSHHQLKEDTDLLHLIWACRDGREWAGLSEGTLGELIQARALMKKVANQDALKVLLPEWGSTFDDLLSACEEL